MLQCLSMVVKLQKGLHMSLNTINAVDTKIKEALAAWVRFQKHDQNIGTLAGGINETIYNGGLSYSQSDATEDEDRDSYIAIKLAHCVNDCYLNKMELPEQLAMMYFHCASVIKPQRYRIEDAYKIALYKIQVALKKKDLI